MSELKFTETHTREATVFLSGAEVQFAVEEMIRREHKIPYSAAIRCYVEFRFEDVNGRPGLLGAKVCLVENMITPTPIAPEPKRVSKPIPKPAPSKSARRK